MVLRALGETYTNAESRGHAGDSHRRSDDRMPQRAQAQPVDRNSSPERGRPSSRMPGVAFIKLESSTIRAGWIPECISIATARNGGRLCRKGAKLFVGAPG